MKHLQNLLLILVLVSIGNTLYAQCQSTIAMMDACYQVGGYYNIVSSVPYNCNQYVRGAIENEWVDMNCGVPDAGENFLSLSPYALYNDNKYIRVCNQSDARLLLLKTSGGDPFDHSMIILNGGFNSYPPGTGDFASTSSGSSAIRYHSRPGYGFTHCDYFLYTYIPSVSLSGSGATLAEGATRAFSIGNKPTFVTGANWSVNTNYLEIVGASQNVSSVTVRGKCGSSDSGNKLAWVKMELRTSCMSSPGDGPVYQKNFYVNCVPDAPDCSGTVDGNYLYTVNYVSSGSHTVQMNEGAWTWVKTQGTTNYWYTANQGRTMYFSLPPGSVTFNAYTSTGCNRTITFSASGSMYSIQSAITGQVVKEGTSQGERQTELVKELAPGLYIIHQDGARNLVRVVDR